MKTTRHIAEGLLQHAHDELTSTPSDTTTHVAQAHASRALVFGMFALTNAVLDVADAIRERRADE